MNKRISGLYARSYKGRPQWSLTGNREAVKQGRFMYRVNLQFDGLWNGERYRIKQVAPVVAETADEIVVVTVYTFFF